MSVRAQPTRGSSRPARRRPAPRRNPDSGAGRIQWDRLGRIAFVALVFILVFSYFNPLYNLARTYRQAGATKVELHRVQAENTQLERRVKHVRGDSVLRREARRQGLIVPGEQAYVVNGIKR
ncbi:MAG: septum formation initiator family protein [Thermoleophilia bacterium]|nr:septum formation initiator family protein [Thermoleophilia bacterium]